jgi:hypothetical protein
MPNYSTYSFCDVSINFSHPTVGQISLNGEGLGSISFSLTQEKTAHDIAADGAVMVSKIAGNAGTITISTQQTSPLHKFLIGWYNYVTSPNTLASEFATASLLLRGVSMGDEIQCLGVSPQKRPDKAYQQQGQQVSWVLMATDIQEN